MIRLLTFACAAAFIVSGGHAAGDAQKDDTGEAEVLFANGSLVRLTLIQDKIDIETLYGKLSVPIKHVRRIEFGLHVPEGTDKKVEAAINQLSSGEYKERDAAVRTLVGLGAYAYPAVLKAAKSADPEVAKRATDAAARIRARLPAKELHPSPDDRVVTGKFTIVGRIVTPTILARTEYFGETRLSLPQLRHLRVLTDAKETDVLIDATKYANANQWLETNVAVDHASVLSIAATGQVDLAPQQPGNYVCGPLGYGPRAKGGGFAAGGGGGFGKKGGGMLGPQIVSGTLLGRIGETGEVFIIGERFEATPPGEGKLFLHINPSQYDTSSSGMYQVRIGVKN
jgi:hypothetical protein